jgi:CheY-like chemotaxis protein/two-component sensor histidine kinase
MGDRPAHDLAGTFLESLAHELRNPLAPIRNSLEILRQLAPGNGAVADAHAIIDRQVAHLLRLVDALLDASRVAQGTVELRRDRCSLSTIVRQAVDEHRTLFRDHGIAVTVSVPPDDFWVEGDPARLGQVFGNILHNAGKFTPKGGWVTVRLLRDDASRDAVVEIADTGIGMDRALLERAFVPFVCAPRRSDGAHNGFGLGLAVVRSLVELHGGHVAAASEGAGRGTRVTVTMPAAAARPEVAHNAPGPERNSLRILVVDDNVDAAESLRMVLEMLGHAATTVYLGHDAIGAAERWQPDVLLCDIDLPAGMDGYDVARSFRAHPSLRGMYLIALTGWGLEEDQRRSHAAGFDLHLTKPVFPDQLESVLVGVARLRSAS